MRSSRRFAASNTDLTETWCRQSTPDLENGDHNIELIGTAAEVREAQQDIDDDPTIKFKGWKKDVWDLTTDEWQPTSAICDALPEDRQKTRNANRMFGKS